MNYFIGGVLHDKTGDSITARAFYTTAIEKIDNVLDTLSKSHNMYNWWLMNKAQHLILLARVKEANQIAKNLNHTEYIGKSKKEILDIFFSTDSWSLNTDSSSEIITGEPKSN